MEVTLNGKTFVVNAYTTNIDKAGLITGTVRYLPKPAEYIEVGSEGPIKGDDHPLDSRLTVESVSMEYEEGEGVVVATYTGILLSQDTDATNPTEDDEERSLPVYALDYGLSEEPIETHPDFATFAGTPSAITANSGAVFYSPELNKNATEDDPEADADNNDKYQFSHFATGGDYAGIESYLDPATATFTESYTTDKRPTTQLAGAGTVQNPPNAPATTREWLYMGLSYEERGDVFSVTRTWKMSGENGWNNTIYG